MPTEVVVSFTENPKWREEIATSREMGEELRKKTMEYMPLLQTMAGQHVRTGQWLASFKVRRRIERIYRMRRQTVRLVSTDPKGWAKEWGNKAHHDLGRTSDAMRNMR